MARTASVMTLILDLDERLDSEDVRLEIDRCYSYVKIDTGTAPIRLRRRAAEHHALPPREAGHAPLSRAEVEGNDGNGTTMAELVPQRAVQR